jgi:hypothetical protein
MAGENKTRQTIAFVFVFTFVFPVEAKRIYLQFNSIHSSKTRTHGKRERNGRGAISFCRPCQARVSSFEHQIQNEV